MSDTTLLLDDEHNHRPRYVLVAMGAWISSFSMGSVLAYSAPALPSMDEPGSHLVLTVLQQSLFASLIGVAAIPGCLIASKIQTKQDEYEQISVFQTKTGVSIEKYGRKSTLLFSSVPFVAGWILIAYSGNLDSKTTLFLGRMLTGLCCGTISMTTPIYIAETSDPEKRGFLGSGFQLSSTMGIVFTYILGKYSNWADLALYLSAAPLLLLIVMLLMPESPIWLLKKGRISEATENNLFLFGAEGSRRLAVDLPVSTINNNESMWETFKETLGLTSQPQYYKPLIITMFLMFFQQMCGVNAIIFFMTSIFAKVGYKEFSPADSTIVVGIIQVISTLVSCFLCDRYVLFSKITR